MTQLDTMRTSPDPHGPLDHSEHGQHSRATPRRPGALDPHTPFSRCALVVVALLAGCSGVIDEPATQANADPDPLPQGDSPRSEEGFVEDTTCVPGPGEVMTRVARLTHVQYDRTVSDLLYLDAAPSAEFIADPTFAGFDNNADGMVVSARLARDYRRAAEELAVQVVGDAAAMGRLVTCDAAADPTGCARQTVQQLGARAFRRPMTTDELDRYTALHARGAELVASGDAFADGVQLVVEAMLQSPKFLYRAELSQQTDDDGRIVLSDHEIAGRLAYALWNTMPDAELRSAADAGELRTPAQVQLQAERMLDDPRAEVSLNDFARQWLDFARFEDLNKDPALFPGLSAQLSQDMATEVRMYLRDVVFTQADAFEALYASPATFVNDSLAEIYGLPQTGRTEFEQVQLDPTQRAGLLTQVGFLASHAYTDKSSPIHRGVFVHRQVLCTDLPDPPGGIDFTLPPLSDSIRTTRQQVENHTSGATCQTCHGVINPVGFAFEHYDSIGSYRDTDNDESVDSSGSLQFDGVQHAFSDAVDLSQQIASSEQARRCFATQWLRYSQGREENAADSCTVDLMGERLAAPDYAIRDMMADMTQTRAFMQRTAEVSP